MIVGAVADVLQQVVAADSGNALVNAANASMGTALTERQLKELGRLTRRLWLCFDGDAAGQNMTTTCTWKTCLWVLERIGALEAIEVQDFIIEAGTVNGIQMGPHTILDEGIERTLDLLAETAKTNILMPYSHAYNAGLVKSLRDRADLATVEDVLRHVLSRQATGA